MTKTTIEWADRVWNPTTGCTQVSEGCRNCYAKELHNRRHEAWKRGAKLPAQYAQAFGEIQLNYDRLEKPLTWKQPQIVFVDSMSDLFHKDIDSRFIGDVFFTMQRSPWLTYVILTKRPERMAALLDAWRIGRSIDHWPVWPLPNVWLGVSVENQQAADERIPLLLMTPAAKRVVSVEPMLERLDLKSSAWGEGKPRPSIEVQAKQFMLGELAGLDWVICGCESGVSARRLFDMDWVRELRDQCQAAGVPFFFKQGRDETGKLVKMPSLDGQVWDQYPLVQGVPMPELKGAAK